MLKSRSTRKERARPLPSLWTKKHWQNSDAGKGNALTYQEASSPAGPVISVRNLCKSYGPQAVLRGVSFDVMKGETLVVIGPSGGGKSTLLRCVNLLEGIDEGSIWSDGHQITGPGVNPNLVRRSIGMVFQQFDLFPHINVLKNLTLAPTKVLKRNPEEAAEAGMRLLQRFGLASKAEKFPSQLSGGEQQRVAIIRALMMNPKVMLFDEVTSALDPELSGEVLDLMNQLSSEGMTMLVVTHEMRFAQDVADKLLFIAEGVIAEAGDPRQVLTAPAEARTRQFLQRVRAG